MSIKEAMQAWNGNPVNVDSVSHLADEGITGLKLVTDDESVMMQEYIKLGDVTARNPREDNLMEKINNAAIDEDNDNQKYRMMANEARDVGRPDIGLVLDIIANEENNHHRILNAFLPVDEMGIGLQPGMEEEYPSGERQEYITDIAADMETYLPGNSVANQQDVDEWLLKNRPGEVFTTKEHQDLVELINFIHTKPSQ